MDTPKGDSQAPSPSPHTTSYNLRPLQHPLPDGGRPDPGEPPHRALSVPGDHPQPHRGARRQRPGLQPGGLYAALAAKAATVQKSWPKIAASHGAGPRPHPTRARAQRTRGPQRARAARPGPRNLQGGAPRGALPARRDPRAAAPTSAPSPAGAHLPLGASRREGARWGSRRQRVPSREESLCHAEGAARGKAWATRGGRGAGGEAGPRVRAPRRAVRASCPRARGRRAPARGSQSPARSARSPDAPPSPPRTPRGIFGGAAGAPRAHRALPVRAPAPVPPPRPAPPTAPPRSASRANRAPATRARPAPPRSARYPRAPEPQTLAAPPQGAPWLPRPPSRPLVTEVTSAGAQKV
ncbi:basic salivary proline-rich protein 2-like [Cervus canadensis]|uniref:basic salivary proline-rich protein 2-like n=1 Tax=Cervus canadensis TaxID=1574408 RepID=UPI001C9E7AF1|nr:basic salivary proline-rich protein 2-like [Cervus canadensis]